MPTDQTAPPLPQTVAPYVHSDTLAPAELRPPPPFRVRLNAVALAVLGEDVAALQVRMHNARSGEWRDDVAFEALFAVRKAVDRALRAANRNLSGLGILSLPYAHWLLLHHTLWSRSQAAVHAVDWAVKNHPQAHRYQLKR